MHDDIAVAHLTLQRSTLVFFFSRLFRLTHTQRCIRLILPIASSQFSRLARPRPARPDLSDTFSGLRIAFSGQLRLLQLPPASKVLQGPPTAYVLSLTGSTAPTGALMQIEIGAFLRPQLLNSAPRVRFVREK